MFVFENAPYVFNENVGTVQNVVCVVLSSGTVSQNTAVLIGSGLPGDSAAGTYTVWSMYNRYCSEY